MRMFQLQGFALFLDELHKVPVSPFLQPVEVPLEGSMTLWCIIHSLQVCVISKFTEGAPCPIIPVINEDGFGGLGSPQVVVGVDDLRGLFQPS